MRIIIVGAGMVGTNLARHLVAEKHEVSIIEVDAERSRHVSNRLDCMVINSKGNNIPALEEAGIARADALVCVTDSDEVNIICCELAASRCPKLLKIARVRNDDYLVMKAGAAAISGVDYFVHPDVEAARSVLNAVVHGAAGDILRFANTPYELGSVEIKPGSGFDGLMMKDYRNIVKEDSLVTLVEHGNEILLPRGSTTLFAGDRINVLAGEKDLDAIFKLAGLSESTLRKIGIVGGSRAGVLITEGLLGNSNVDITEDKQRDSKSRSKFFSFIKTMFSSPGRQIIIIEKDYNLCKDLSARFPEALVLNEDISDESFVAEEKINDLDLIICATEDQELNMIAAVYLKGRGVKRAIAMVAGGGYAAIARQLGVDVVIPMTTAVVDSILSHLMGQGISAIHRLGGGKIEVLELELTADTPLIGKGIAELKLTSGGLVMLVNRGERSFIPRGDYIFESGDKIILLTKNGSENSIEIEKYFGLNK